MADIEHPPSEVLCPRCGDHVPRRKVDAHLDGQCPGAPMSEPEPMIDDLPDSLRRWLTFLFRDARCQCDWTWRRRLSEWELTTYVPDCPHHAFVYGPAATTASGTKRKD